MINGDSIMHSHYYRPQRSWGKVIFPEACVKNSVHRGGGVSRPTPKGEVDGSGWGGGLQAHTQGEVEGSGWGGLQAHTQGGRLRGLAGGLQAHTQGVSRPGGCVSQHALRQTPPSRWLLLWVVRILLECILVHTDYYLFKVPQRTLKQVALFSRYVLNMK